MPQNRRPPVNKDQVEAFEKKIVEPPVTKDQVEAFEKKIVDP